MTNERGSLRPQRRAFLKNGTLLLAAASARSELLSADESPTGLRIGLVTDLHYADKPPAGTRHYRQSLVKLDEAAQQFERDQPDFIVELGDLIDAADSVELEQQYLKTIDARFSRICNDRHYVLGNHCVDTLTKEEFLAGVGQAKSYYSFERGDFHFVVLDACFRSDGVPYGRKNSHWQDTNVPTIELDWLRADLQACQKPVIVFAHQRLDVSKDHGVKNSADVRAALEASGNVLAVFQGHSHQNELQQINGIHYCTLVAMVEGSDAANNGYSLLNVQPNGTIRLAGFRAQASHVWSRVQDSQ